MTNDTMIDSDTLAAIKANAAAVPTEDLAKEIAFAQAAVPSPSAEHPEAVAWCAALLDERWRRAGIDIEALTSDGDVIDLPDGRKLRLRVEHDDQDPFGEYETYGKVEAGVRNDYTNDGRPSGFDGNSEKLAQKVWWQPPAGAPQRGTEEFRRFRSLVIDLLNYGMHGVTLEVLDGKDAYRRPIVVQVANLGGIDSLEDGYLADVVKELAEELELADLYLRTV
jgi:hypothetical protein